jgi:prepilin-type N-terminal cleavage/methylation domain-containing protein
MISRLLAAVGSKGRTMNSTRYGRQSISSERGGFSLVELLVVIAVIALLIAILLPGLGQTKKMGKMLREQALAQQQIVAYGSYIVDYRDRVVIGAPHWNWAHGAHNQLYGMTPGDPVNPGRYFEGSICKIWTWHFFSNVNIPYTAIQIDKQTYNDEFFPRTKSDGGGSIWISPGSNWFQTALAYHPTLGYNAIFLGGAYTHGAFLNGQPGPNPRNQGGGYFVIRASQVRFPQQLLVYASARGGDVQDGSWWNWGTNNPDSGRIRPGYWLIRAPRAHPNSRGSHSLGGGWVPSDNFDPRQVPSSWGNLDARHFKKVITASFDGHVTAETVEQLRDMRRWANYADRPDWNFQPGP